LLSFNAIEARKRITCGSFETSSEVGVTLERALDVVKLEASCVAAANCQEAIMKLAYNHHIILFIKTLLNRAPPRELANSDKRAGAPMAPA
jgi:hypothetical protein